MGDNAAMEPAPQFLIRVFARARKLAGLLALAFLLPLSGCARGVQSAPPVAASPDPCATRAYSVRMASPEFALEGESVLRLRDCVVLVVRGFMSDQVKPWIMRDQMRELKALGVECRMVDAGFDSEGSPEQNGAAIAGAICAAEKPVILLTHSKGSVDALVALVGRPELRSKVRGWISLDGAIQGSPLADWCMAPGPAAGARIALLDWALRNLLGGEIESVESLTTSRRVAYLKKHAQEIADLAAALPIISYGAAASPWRSGLAIATRPFLRAEPENDGLVPIARAAIPGSTVIHDKPGPDHHAQVMGGPFSRADRRRRLRVLLSALLA